MGSRILNGQSSDLFSNEPFEKRPVMTTGLRRCIGCLIFIGLFLQNSLIIGGSIAKRDLQLKASYASSPPCIQDPDFHCNDHFETHLFGNAFWRVFEVRRQVVIEWPCRDSSLDNEYSPFHKTRNDERLEMLVGMQSEILLNGVEIAVNEPPIIGLFCGKTHL